MTIKIYSTPACVYCKKAKDLFTNNNVEFTEINVAGSDEARDELLSKTGKMSVPVIEVDNKLYVGYNELGLMKAIGLGPVI